MVEIYSIKLVINEGKLKVFVDVMYGVVVGGL